VTGARVKSREDEDHILFEMPSAARSDAPRHRSCLISKRVVARTLRVLPDSRRGD
jgi:hypothetical protein